MSIDNSEDWILERICIAAFEGQTSSLATLLENQVDLNRVGKNWTPLHAAIENENLDCVRLLINYGASIEYCGENVMGTPLEHAIDICIQSNNNTGGKDGDENVEIIKLLLDSGANPDTGEKIAQLYNSVKIRSLLKEYTE